MAVKVTGETISPTARGDNRRVLVHAAAGLVTHTTSFRELALRELLDDIHSRISAFIRGLDSRGY